MHRQFTIGQVFIIVVVLSAFLAFGRCSYLAIEENYLRTHPEEAAVARRIRELGGAYHVDTSKDRHITGVVLDETRATDDDLGAVLGLSELQYLDFQKTRVSDVSLPAIFAHKRLREIRLRGSLVTPSAIGNALGQNERIYVHE